MEASTTKDFRDMTSSVGVLRLESRISSLTKQLLGRKENSRGREHKVLSWATQYASIYGRVSILNSRPIMKDGRVALLQTLKVTVIKQFPTFYVNLAGSLLC